MVLMKTPLDLEKRFLAAYGLAFHQGLDVVGKNAG